jgi:hypothetical protein
VGLQQVLPLARALNCQKRVLADHQPLTGERVIRDLGQVGSVKDPELKVAIVDQGTDLGRA